MLAPIPKRIHKHFLFHLYRSQDNTAISGTDKQNSGGDAGESRRTTEGVTEAAVVTRRREPGPQPPLSILRDNSGLQQLHPPHEEEQEPHDEPEQQQQKILPAGPILSGGAPFRHPSNTHAQTPDGVTIVVGSGDITANSDNDETTRFAYASGESSPTPGAGKPAVDATKNNTTTTTTIVITSGEKVSQRYSSVNNRSVSIEEQRGYDRDEIGGGRRSREGRNPVWTGGAGEPTGEGSEEEELAGSGAGGGEFSSTRQKKKKIRTKKKTNSDYYSRQPVVLFSFWPSNYGSQSLKMEKLGG